MVAVPDAVAGALVTYALALHLYLAYLYGVRQASENTLSATEADINAGE